MIRYNNRGQLGLGHTTTIGDNSWEMGNSLRDTDLGTGFLVIQLAAGYYHNCALSNTSEVKCWG